MYKYKTHLIITSLLIIFSFITVRFNFLQEDQNIPSYIKLDNTHFAYRTSEEKVTLGRVLFYDKKLSLNNSTSCASCHKQEFAFSDTLNLSIGQNGGITGRHSMRLINTRFSKETHFFWDERARTLEDQTTMPIQDHLEMGFSGMDENPTLDSLIRKLTKIDYYQDLFTTSFGDHQITEERIQHALAQFVRNIQSFDSKYDIGKAEMGSDRVDFSNFTTSENRGKQLFMGRPNRRRGAGAGCNRCHRAPEFAIGPNVKNNGVIGASNNSFTTDLTITRAPTLRDIVNPNGQLNGPLMHDASKTSLREVIDHYNQVPNNPELDRRLKRRGGDLQLTETEKVDLENFLRTLTGKAVYTDKKWADPFRTNNTLDISKLLP